MVGQNLGLSCRQWPYKLSIKAAIQDAIQGWYDEYKMVPILEEVKRKGSSQRKGIGHWTQFVQSKVDCIDCSVVQYIEQEHFNCIMTGWFQFLWNFLFLMKI